MKAAPPQPGQAILNNPPFPGDPVPPVGPDDWTMPVQDVFKNGTSRTFLWGVQDSATQNEGGGTINPDGSFNGEPIDNNFIDAVLKDPSRVVDHTVPLPGNNDWNRTAEKAKQLKEMGCNAYGLTIDWARIFPVDGGPPNQAAMDHYLDAFRQYFDAGIEPVVTFVQYAFPKYYVPRGGMLADDFVDGFDKYVRYVMGEIGKMAQANPKYTITLYNTLNEPNAMAGMSYMEGAWPPFEQDLLKFAQANLVTLKMHAVGARAIHEVGKSHGIDAKVAIAHNMRPFHPANPLNPFDVVVAKIPDQIINRWFLNSVAQGKPDWSSFLDAVSTLGTLPGLNKIPTVAQLAALDTSFDWSDLKDSFDWVGLNYYVRDAMKFSLGGPRFGLADVVRDPTMPVTTRPDDNTYDPDGMYECLMDIWGQFHKPIMITEWGVEDITTRNADGILVDQLRPRHQIDTFANLIHFARRVPGGLFGALEWTQDRNWEWVEGYTPDAGLNAFDPKTGIREPKFGLTVFRRLAQGLPKAWRTARNEQNPVERDKWARAAAERAGLPGGDAAAISKPALRSLQRPGGEGLAA